jgi:Ca2+/Na+ antiporter
MPKLRRAHRPLLLAPIAGGTCVCIAYLMVAWLETSACVLGVPTISLSLLLAASGTSLPNCLVAMYVAKKGRGTTAVSTVFGSNIFDILIALALPWAIYSSIFGPITVFSSLGFGTAYALTTIMIATFALFVILSATNAWVVTHPHAWIYLAIYAAFVVYVILDAIPGIVPGPASR